MIAPNPLRGAAHVIVPSLACIYCLANAGKSLAPFGLTAAQKISHYCHRVTPNLLAMFASGRPGLLEIERSITLPSFSPIAIQSEHPVVEAGVYRYVRHPSYAGLLLAFLGLGVFFANWLSIFGLLVPITFSVVHRVVREERALLTFLGAPYAAYCSRTKRFIPWVI